MTTETQYTRQPQPETKSAGVPILYVIMRTLSNWPWLILSIVICCALGVLYILSTPPKYIQTAVLIIKEDDEGGSVNKDLAQIGIFQNSSNLQNEVATLKSPDLMEEVVERLNLDYYYFHKGIFHDKVAYGKNLPVNVTIPELSNKVTATFNLIVKTNGDVIVSDCKTLEDKEKKESDKTYHGKLNKPFKTFIGEMTVTPTPYYDKSQEEELHVYKDAMFNAVESCCKQLTVEPDEEGGTAITLSFTGTSIQRADDLLTTLVQIYRENWIEEKNQMAVATSNFINERLKVIEKELGNVDSDISQFKSKNMLPDVGKATENYMMQNQELSDQLLSLGSELQMSKYLRDYVTSPAHKNSLLPTNVGLSSVSSAIEAYNEKLLSRNDLEAKSSDQNPHVKTMDADLSAMRQAIIGNIDNNIVKLQNKISSLQGAQSETRNKISTSPTQAQFLLSVERQQKVKENLYLFLLQKREDNEINQSFTAQNFRLIQRPGGSDRPVAPNKKAILMGALILGLVIPIGIQYYKITTDTKVHDRNDCKALTMPMLGEIPFYKGKKDPQHEILVRPAMRDVLNESFRVLRTNIDFVKPDKPGEAFVMAITSINPGSGKSFIAINIATAIAIRNNRVLVIDADLRRGSSSAYGGSPKKGLSDYLAGRVRDINSLIVKPLGDEGPDLLPIGSIPPNPTELIESPLLGEMIEKLKKEYDYIICDCPPIDIVADTRIIDKYVDRTIFVIRAGLLDKAMLPEIDNLYTTKQYSNMVYILNGTKGSGGYGGYGYGKKGYGYGYGNIHDDKGKKS
ncbi:MAG: polysaccharide biosynthesis tyrosine autokinase [Muribaculaceae bacterium]|nr:polysaccharide biosynthesis tyrosine autokinase [Muribaculaceae bacterium]